MKKGIVRVDKRPADCYTFLRSQILMLKGGCRDDQSVCICSVYHVCFCAFRAAAACLGQEGFFMFVFPAAFPRCRFFMFSERAALPAVAVAADPGPPLSEEGTLTAFAQ